MSGRLYGVGVGPGDKELVTLKAVRIIKEADIIAAPLMKDGSSTAYSIVKDYIDDGKPVLYFNMPMNKEFDKLYNNYSKIADKLEEYLNQGKTVAFLTLGDTAIYSTYMQVNNIIKERGYETELIPGITSFSACAARLNTDLCRRNEPLIIVPSSYEDLYSLLDVKGNKVLMKAAGKFDSLKSALQERGMSKNAMVVERCGLEGERVYNSVDDAENLSYFSVVIIKEEENG